MINLRPLKVCPGKHPSSQHWFVALQRGPSLGLDVTNPYEFIGFGALDVTKPYEFIGFGAKI